MIKRVALLGGALLMVMVVILAALPSILKYRPIQIVGDSMSPSYRDGQYYLTDIKSFEDNLIKRGDVVVYEHPDNKYLIIQRIIALPGEEVMITDNQVYINGRELKEAYLVENSTTQPTREMPDGTTLVLKESEYFLLGDNRADSLDSRYLGPISNREIKSKVGACYFKCK